METKENNVEMTLEEYVYKYMPILKKMSLSYPESIREDIVQEGLIGLIKAYNSFDSSRETQFDSYASLCIKNNINNALKKLNQNYQTTSIDEFQKSDEEFEESIIDKDFTKSFFKQLKKTLSEKELTILTYYLQNKPISAIAKETKTSTKSIYNSLFRIRNKIKQLYN